MRKAEYVDKWRFCEITNSEKREGGIAEAMAGADVVIALSRPGPGVIQPEWVGEMAADSIVFACANPVPEIWPWEAEEAGAAIVATGRSDFPNQVNNSLGFPGIFRGTLDVRASTITDSMCMAAATALADTAVEKGIAPDRILPTMDDWEVFPREAAAVAANAVEEGIARKPLTYAQELENASRIIGRARNLTEAMMKDGFIAEAED
jgi:malate dehydrogenase (oxaloacetate-decarboxylating)